MKKRTLIAVLIAFASISVHAQRQKATTESGKKVILNENGTWKYDEEREVADVTKDPSDCNKWIRVEVDKMTGKATIGGKEPIVISDDDGKTAFGIMILSIGGLIGIDIKVVGASNCIDEGAKINILFEDDSRLELRSDFNFNCKGIASLYFGDEFGKWKELNEFKAKKISTMRVWTEDGFVEHDFTQENKDNFYNIINCLMK